jgi:hypothetical protein
MPKYREQVNSLMEKLENKIKDDKRTGLKVTKSMIAGSWKKGTILRPTGDNPIDIDLVLFVEGEDLKDDIKKLHDFIIQYLGEIYPQKDLHQDVDAEGNTKAITITFSGTGLQIDIVPVVPLKFPKEFVWQPQRGGGGKYITSVTKQLNFSKQRKTNNDSYTAIVRAIKWWRNYKELQPTDNESGLSSFAIELIVSSLEIYKEPQKIIEDGLIEFFQFVSVSKFPVIKFDTAINDIPKFDTPIFIADSTNNENNTAKKITQIKWNEIVKEANEAFESLNIAISRNFEGDTIDEWKNVFGPSFNING